ncbi:hypothetical protein GQ43DRAFT_110830 [Delitschia confertaspora ATCC 74209]|uniref:Uncharacterized protein n=1 Tax=Delitschia confertaspora ATCC 74209 TaxID=1513339 RepID=A0A9P4JI91_9PLEO|nr:hypothetical protein GQ43DRAFT_110830 [Delitschia confertaspora ATCC 74209]
MLNLNFPSPQSQSERTCYFSITPSPPSHFSLETPNTPLLDSYHSDTDSDPSHPLLAVQRSQTPLGPLPPSSFTMDASKLLQLQTAAAYAETKPRQGSGSSEDSMPAMLCCSRCRRSSSSNSMVSFGTNLYYCNHCASIVGYNSG